MSCMICGGHACASWMHSQEEREFFEEAETAYEKYIEIRDKCREAYENRELKEG